MAPIPTYKSEAIQYFQDALMEEVSWEYQERQCRTLLEDAIGSTMLLSTDDLFNIETMEVGRTNGRGRRVPMEILVDM
jgi:hypothetical protein